MAIIGTMPEPRRYAKGRAKREEILAVALDVIARNGYRRSSLREIASAVGLSNAGLLHYFGSKEELFAEVLRARDEKARAAVAAGDSASALVDIARHNALVPGLVHLYSRLSAEAVEPEHGAHSFFVERYRTLRQSLAGQLREAADRGELRVGVDVDRLARLLIAAADGLQVQWLLDPEFEMADDIAHLLSLVAGTAPSREAGR